MRRLVLALLSACLASPALAVYCARDNVPAAALLVPFAQVAVKADGTVDPDGATTILRITNVSSEAQIVHLTIWNMFAQGVVNFDVILSGYDVLQMNLRDILAGRLDLLGDTDFNEGLQRADARYTPGELGPDSRSEYQGVLPVPRDRDEHPAASTPGCDKFPYQDYTASGSFECIRSKLRWPLEVSRAQAMHPYNPWDSRTQRDHWLQPDNIALDTLVFYLTAEVVRGCDTLFPNEQGYWSADGPGPTYANVLTGQVLLVDAGNGFSEAMPAVALEADVDGSGLWNFHDQHSRPWGKNAAYEPLPTAFGFPYERATAGIEVASNLLLFQTREGFAGLETEAECEASFPQLWLSPTRIANTGFVLYAWDTDEFPMSISDSCPITCPPPPPPLNMLPFATQRVPITDDNFDLPGESGWMLIALPAAYAEEYAPHSEPRVVGATTFEPITNPTGTMGWAAVQLTMRAPGAPFGYSAITEATVLGNRHCNPGDVLPSLNTYDGAVADGAQR